MAHHLWQNGIGFPIHYAWPWWVGLELSNWKLVRAELCGDYFDFSIYSAVAGILPCNVLVLSETLEDCIHIEHLGTWSSAFIWHNCSSGIKTFHVLHTSKWPAKCLELSKHFLRWSAAWPNAGVRNLFAWCICVGFHRSLLLCCLEAPSMELNGALQKGPKLSLLHIQLSLWLLLVCSNPPLSWFGLCFDSCCGDQHALSTDLHRKSHLGGL